MNEDYSLFFSAPSVAHQQPLLYLSRAMAAKLPPYEVQRNALTASLHLRFRLPTNNRAEAYVFHLQLTEKLYFLSRAIQLLKHLALREAVLGTGLRWRFVMSLSPKWAELLLRYSSSF